MSKTKKPPKSRDSIPKLSGQLAESAVPQHAPWFRETVESIVIAFVLAFLFRTFEAEAFVIPTGSMATTLMGQHKDVDCTQCGHRFQVNASIDEAQSPVAFECVAGVCPNCRYTMPMAADLPGDIWENYPAQDVSRHRSYNGDRILVNKYIYAFGDPQRWDIVVFHFPGDAQMNYIKRLVGLPGETLRILQGDLFVKNGAGGSDGEFHIEHKPAGKVLAMRQIVHDTAYDPATLVTAGWPLRWSGPESGQGKWKLDTQLDGQTVRQRFTVDSAADDLAWIRYRNRVPDYGVWRELLLAQQRAAQTGGVAAKIPPNEQQRSRPQLITDFNAYNTRVLRQEAVPNKSLASDRWKMGLHWVGDLMVEANIEVEEARGEIVLDLVEGGKHFTCTINLTSGEAKLSAGGVDGYAPTAKTIVTGPGNYRIGFANVDDQLLLFVKQSSLIFSQFVADDLVAFNGSTVYDADRVFGDRRRIRPETSELDPGDLAPAGVGAHGAKLAVTQLQMWRDNYYIADRARDMTDNFGRQVKGHAGPITDIDWPGGFVPADLAFDPSQWDRFRERRHEDFPLGKDQFFVMGDNSPESSDARLWCGESSRGVPGGEYLERRLLIGKALCVYWPHSWNRIPGTPIPFPLFPNFEDMRLVR
jgi:signal peptidase I